MARAAPRSVIFGCAGFELTSDERAFFSEVAPLGFILFERNCRDPEQVKSLCRSLRDLFENRDVPILIDQEGGRVRRLKPPHWRAAPPARAFGELARLDPGAAEEALRLNAYLLAGELRALGIDVDCWPVLDVSQDDADPIIGDRAFDTDPELIARLGRIACQGLFDGDVIPVIKHIPGHGRARADSHKELPRVAAGLDELRRTDFAPFRAVAERYDGFAMTAHVVYEAIDPDRPATVSPKVINDVIRDWIGFSGLLISDDLSMNALHGDLAERARAALAAGCDAVLHCNGKMDEMRAVASAVREMDDDARNRLARAGSAVRERPYRRPDDWLGAERRLSELLKT